MAVITKRPQREKLNDKQRLFVREYALTGNGRQSAIKVGYSAHSADVTASKLLSQPKVKAELARVQGRLVERYELKADAVLAQLAKMVFVDPRKFVDSDGNPIPLHQLTPEAAAALQGFEVDTVGGGVKRTKYKLVDRGAAVDKAMRHLGLFEKDNGQAGSAIGNLMAEIHGAGSRLAVKP